MRIGINTLFENPRTGTGGLVYISNLVHSLAEIDDQNEYILFVSSTNRRSFDVGKANFYLVKCPFSKERRISTILFEHTELPFLIKKHRIDVFHSPGNIAPIFLPCCSVVTVHTLHHYILPNSVEFASRIYRRLLMPITVSRAELIIGISDYVCQILAKFLKVPEVKMVTIYEAIDPSFGDGHSSLGERSPFTLNEYILFVSALWPYKNAHTLIRAFARLKKDYHIPHLLVLVGRGWDSYQLYLKSVAKKEQIEDSVLFLGHLSHGQMKVVYSKSSVLVYPSLEEYFGFPALEGMACGVPVVASNRSSIPEVVGDAGILINPEDPVEMANAIWRILSDKTLRDDLIQRGLQRVKKFTWERTAQQTILAYRRAYELWKANRLNK